MDLPYDNISVYRLYENGRFEERFQFAYNDDRDFEWAISYVSREDSVKNYRELNQKHLARIRSNPRYTKIRLPRRLQLESELSHLMRTNAYLYALVRGRKDCVKIICEHRQQAWRNIHQHYPFASRSAEPQYAKITLTSTSIREPVVHDRLSFGAICKPSQSPLNRDPIPLIPHYYTQREARRVCTKGLPNPKYMLRTPRYAKRPIHS